MSYFGDFRENLSEGVSVAAEMADKHSPDWYRKIDEETLSMMNVTRCIVGQASSFPITEGENGNYAEGIVDVFGANEYTVVVKKDTIDLGMVLTAPSSRWMEEVNKRLAVDEIESELKEREVIGV